MKLLIGKNLSPQENTITLNTTQLKYNSVNLFIASKLWEEIDLYVDDDTDPKALFYIPSKTRNFKVYIDDTADSKVLECLMTIYPDNAPIIREKYLSGHNQRKVLISYGIYLKSEG